MYCSTCGARLVEGRSRCDACGAPVHTVATPTRAEQPWREPVVIATCPRCRYRGDGVSYFSRGTHVAGAVALTLLTAGIMGAGGIAYYFMRKDHLICPRCGFSWGKEGEVALVPVTEGGREAVVPRIPGGGRGKRVASIALFLLAALLVIVGIGGSEAVPVILGSIAASAGIALTHSANIERQRRREALLAALQLPVLKLAREKGGHLTVTEVATDLGWPIRRAERVLQSMDDGLRVTSDVTDEGVIVYEFPELLRSGRPAIEGGGPHSSHTDR